MSIMEETRVDRWLWAVRIYKTRTMATDACRARVGPPVAATCLVDHSPPRPPSEWVAPLFAREPSAGRPTKRDRRETDRFRGREPF